MLRTFLISLLMEFLFHFLLLIIYNLNPDLVYYVLITLPLLSVISKEANAERKKIQKKCSKSLLMKIIISIKVIIGTWEHYYPQRILQSF